VVVVVVSIGEIQMQCEQKIQMITASSGVYVP
jgi:hypothetical protein